MACACQYATELPNGTQHTCSVVQSVTGKASVPINDSACADCSGDNGGNCACSMIVNDILRGRVARNWAIALWNGQTVAQSLALIVSRQGAAAAQAALQASQANGMDTATAQSLAAGAGISLT